MSSSQSRVKRRERNLDFGEQVPLKPFGTKTERIFRASISWEELFSQLTVLLYGKFPIAGSDTSSFPFFAAPFTQQRRPIYLERIPVHYKVPNRLKAFRVGAQVELCQ